MVVSATAIPDLQRRVTRELLKDGGASFKALSKGSVFWILSQNTVDRFLMTNAVYHTKPLDSLYYVMSGKLWQLNFTNYRPPSSPNFSQRRNFLEPTSGVQASTLNLEFLVNAPISVKLALSNVIFCSH